MTATLKMNLAKRNNRANAHALAKEMRTKMTAIEEKKLLTPQLETKQANLKKNLNMQRVLPVSAHDPVTDTMIKALSNRSPRWSLKVMKARTCPLKMMMTPLL